MDAPALDKDDRFLEGVEDLLFERGIEFAIRRPAFGGTGLVLCLPLRRKEHVMLRVRQMNALQKFASVHANVYNHFNLDRHLTDRQTYKANRSAVLTEWQTLMA